MPEALEGLVDYFRSISGEHPNWDEYREAMRIQDKSLIRITPTRWGPIATGGFPAEVAERLGGPLNRWHCTPAGFKGVVPLLWTAERQPGRVAPE